VAPLTLLATPYGFEITGYYRWMLLGSPLRKYVVEWQPATLGIFTALFFVTAVLVLVGLGRHGREVSVFERLALPLLFFAGLASVRNAAWLALAVAVSGPLLLDAAWRPAGGELPALALRLNRTLAGCAVALTAVVVAASLARPAASFESQWPAAGADLVVRAAGADGLVLADDVHSDWLLWKKPELSGRIGYDVRFELLTAPQLKRLWAFRERNVGRGLARPYRVLTFPSAKMAAPWRGAGATRFEQDGLVVIVRR
jgi:hypothetical protein